MSDNDTRFPPGLRQLSLHNNLTPQLLDVWLDQLSKDRHIETIDIKNVRFTAAECVQKCGRILGEHPALLSLRVRQLLYPSETSLQTILGGLSSSRSLQKLFLWHTVLNDPTVVKSICDAVRDLPTLESLVVVQKHSIITTTGRESSDHLIPLLVAIGKYGSNSSNASNNNSVSVGSSRLRKVRFWEPNPPYPSRDDTVSVACLWGLTQMFSSKALEEISLENFYLGDTGVAVLCRILEGNGRRSCPRRNNVHTLRLENTRCRTEGIRSLGQVLYTNRVLRQLGVVQHNLRGCIRPIVNGILAGRTLRSLDLTKNRLNDDDARLLVRLVPVLEELILNDNNIDDPGSDELTEALTRPGCPLRVLGLSHNMLSEYGMERIAQRLPRIHSLQKLEVACNEHTILTEQAFVEGLRQNWSVLEVDFTVSTGIDYYTGLNKVGRRLLLDRENHVPAGLWPHILHKTISSSFSSSISPVDAIYWLLREKPDLCTTVTRA